MQNTIASAIHLGDIANRGSAAIHIYRDRYRWIACARLKRVGVVTNDESRRETGTIPAYAVGCVAGQDGNIQRVPDFDNPIGCDVSYVAYSDRVGPGLSH